MTHPRQPSIRLQPSTRLQHVIRLQPMALPARGLTLLLTLGLLVGGASPLFAQETATESASQEEKQTADDVQDVELGATKPAHRVGDLYLTGQFSKEELETLKAQGIRRIISLRDASETDWDEQEAVEDAGMEFLRLPISSSSDLNPDLLDKIRELLGEDESTLLHCASANRVGSVWLPYRVLDQGVGLGTALKEAGEVGLRNPTLRQLSLDYIQQQFRDNAELRESVKPGINESFLDPDLDVDSYVGRFEVESREVFAAREAVIEASGIKPGDYVADIGAGTGIYSRLFSRVVGRAGWVYAVDIAPKFIEHINETADDLGLRNITGVVCTEDSVNLPPESVDVVFICDVYHHFEYPQLTMTSVLRSLKPGGTLVVIDFERIEGETRDWLLNHVRAGKDVFRSEIEAAGFEFVEEVDIDGLEENYFLKFKRP